MMPLVRDEARYEILNGEIVYMTPSPSVNHNLFSGNIYSIFRKHFKGKFCTVFGDNLDVYLSEKDVVIPDVTIVCDKSKIKENGIHGSPDLIVEILSPSTAKNDMGYKKELYEKHGVKEYWIVDPVAKSIQIYALKEVKYVLKEVYTLLSKSTIELMRAEDRAEIVTSFHSPLFPELEVELEEVFEGMIES